MEWKEVILADLKLEATWSQEDLDHSKEFYSERLYAYYLQFYDKLQTGFEQIAAKPDFNILEIDSPSLFAEVPDLSGEDSTLYRMARSNNQWFIKSTYWSCHHCIPDKEDDSNRVCYDCKGNGLCNFCKGSGREPLFDQTNADGCEFCRETGVCSSCNGSRHCPLCSNSDLPGWWKVNGSGIADGAPVDEVTSPTSAAHDGDTEPIAPNATGASADDWKTPLVRNFIQGAQPNTSRKDWLDLRLPAQRDKFERFELDRARRIRMALPRFEPKLIEESESQILAELADPLDDDADPLATTRYCLVRENDRWRSSRRHNGCRRYAALSLFWRDTVASFLNHGYSGGRRYAAENASGKQGERDNRNLKTYG